MPSPHVGHVTPSLSIQRLIQWFRDNKGWLNPDVDISYSESHGFHVCATRPLSSPVIVRCPLTLTISHLNLDHGQSTVPHVDSQLRPCLGRIPNEVLTYLLLIEQRGLAKQGKSAWQPYLECLPSPLELTTTLWFDDDDLRHLQGTDLLPATKEKRILLEAEYQRAVTVLSELDVKLGHETFTFEDYLWAFTIMSSRSFVSTYMLPNTDTFPILFPVLDILNHSTDAKINWAFDDSCFSLELADPASVLPGNQIFNNYAPKQNGELLMGYGFCIPDNPIEQYAIKMRLPPDMVEAARDMGLYNPDQVPFGLSESIVENDQSAEQHFLRVRGHPFGRYEMDVPWLRGIPPWIVHSTFVATVMQLGHTPENTNYRKPSGMLVLHVLIQIHKAIKAKSSLLPLNPQIRYQNAPPSNSKQKYATIYREGQAKILHSIRTELEAVFSNLTLRNQLPTRAPAVLTTTEALLTLQQEYPSHFHHVTNAIAATYSLPLSHPPQTPSEEKDLWTILIFLFAYLTLTSPTPSPASLITSWILEYLELYTLPSAASLPPETSPSFDESTLGTFVHDASRPISNLNSLHARVPQTTLDERFADLPIWDDDDDVGLQRLGDKVLAWATGVVDTYAVEVPGEVRDGEVGRVGMYVRPYSEVPVAEEWVYEEI